MATLIRFSKNLPPWKQERLHNLFMYAHGLGFSRPMASVSVIANCLRRKFLGSLQLVQ